MNIKSKIFVLISLVTICISMVFGGKIVETVDKTEYVIKQAAVSGTITVHMAPGMFLQMFGDVQPWPKSTSMYFTSADDNDEGSGSHPITVRFVDGSETDISGTMKVILPTTEAQAKYLTTALGFQNYEDLQRNLLLPVTRKALVITANMMTARESYADKRTDFFALTQDQIENGPYIMETFSKIIVDPTDPTGKTQKTVKAKRPKTNKDGVPLREVNPLEGLGIRILQFEVKNFDYPDKVDKQIATQQEALMAIATAKAKAAKAKQDAITVKAEGKANVMTAKYKMEQEKIKAVVDAEKDKAVAKLKAEQKFEVAKLDKKAAEQKKQEEILLGQGESQRKKLNMMADGALAVKVAAWKEVNFKYADAIANYKGDWVSKVNMGSNGQTGSTNGAQALIDMFTIKTAKDLALDMTMKANTTIK